MHPGRVGEAGEALVLRAPNCRKSKAVVSHCQTLCGVVQKNKNALLVWVVFTPGVGNRRIFSKGYKVTRVTFP